jgi:hypothetical protein
VALLALMTLLPLATFSLATPALGAPFSAIDEEGANDEPGQKDLTRLASDDSGLPTSLSVSWNWDITSQSGNNTADGCALFDSDNDGFANFALCEVWKGTPPTGTPTHLETRLYNCNDSRVDRCAGPVQDTSFSSSCTIAVTSDDPFPAGDAYPNDTKATCNIVLADVGAASAKLINVCSYPSQEPNSDPSDCVLIPRDAFLTIVKVASPDDSTQFPFTLDGQAAFTATGSETSAEIPIRSDINHAVDEVIPTGWSLSSAGCTGAGGGNGTADLTTGTISGINPDADDHITCTFNDTRLFSGQFDVDKTANPTSVNEPGGNVTFSVTVFNQFSGGVTLTSLSDNVYNDITTSGHDGIVSTTCSVPQSLAATDGSSGGADTYSCSFVANVGGSTGSTHTDTVTATVDGFTQSDDATVTITDVASAISVTKTANPTSVAEPGGNVTFTVRIDNTSAVDSVTISSLTDNVHGDLDGQGDCAVPQTIAAGGFYECSFTAAVSGNAGGSETDTASASGTDDDGNPVSGSDDATVTITDVASAISVTKTANPTSVAEPGGNVTFTVRIDNTSAVDSVTISSLTDNVHGDLDGQGDCAVPQTIAAGGFYECSFTAAVSGNAGGSETDTASASGTDDDGNPVSGSDDATVTITDVAPDISVQKSANPTSVIAPSGSVTFTVVVTNNSVEAVTLSSLTDDIYGNLNGQGTCATGGSIPANGGTYSCSFTKTVSGSGGTSQTDTVTATAQDDEGNSDSASDDATVNILTQTGRIAPTGTTCQAFRDNPTASANNLEFVNYAVKANKISQVDPGVFFYYTQLTAPSSSFQVVIGQSNNNAAFPLFKVNQEQAIVWNATCTRHQNVTVTIASDGSSVTLNVSGATAGQVYIISVKYDTASVLGTTAAGKPSVLYSFSTSLNGNPILSSSDSLTLRSKK